jgi:hypothetical protein
MPETSERSELEKRLRRLPGQLALALVNATAVLLIVAALLVIVAFNRVEHAAGRISASLTDAVLAQVKVEPARTSSLQAMQSEIGELRTTLRGIREGGANRAEDLQR